MNLKALITTLVLGTSSVALAQPVSFGASAQVDARFGYTTSGPAIRDHRPAEPMRPVVVQAQPQVDDCANVKIGAKGSAYTGPVGYASPNGGWIALTQPTKIGHTGEEISIGADNGRFHTLQLVANAGVTSIKSVVIQFTNGQVQRVDLDKNLDKGC